MAVEPGDLEIACVLADVRIIERTFGMGFLQRTIIQHIIEDHGNA